MESVVEVFIEKAGAPICAKMGQENASRLDFPRIERPSQECETHNRIRQADRRSKPKEKREQVMLFRMEELSERKTTGQHHDLEPNSQRPRKGPGNCK
jgi:hypothetical protein